MVLDSFLSNSAMYSVEDIILKRRIVLFQLEYSLLSY